MILITAATRWEHEPLRRALPSGEARVLLTGVGVENTRKALADFHERPALVISSGFAGALQEGLRCGDIVGDGRGAPPAFLESARRAAYALGESLHWGLIVSAEQAVADPGQKRSLGVERRALAVDMETGAVRQWAQENGAEFIALRVILDSVEQRLPPLPQGQAAGDLLRYALCRPLQWPLLMRMGLLQKTAMRRLSRFMRRFLLELRHEKVA